MGAEGKWGGGTVRRGGRGNFGLDDKRETTKTTLLRLSSWKVSFYLFLCIGKIWLFPPNICMWSLSMEMRKCENGISRYEVLCFL